MSSLGKDRLYREMITSHCLLVNPWEVFSSSECVHRRTAQRYRHSLFPSGSFGISAFAIVAVATGAEIFWPILPFELWKLGCS